MGAALVGLVRTRLELVAIEVDEARIRATEQLVLIIVAGVAFAFALLALSALVVVVYWDTNRIAALSAVVIAYVVVGAIASPSSRHRPGYRRCSHTCTSLR